MADEKLHARILVLKEDIESIANELEEMPDDKFTTSEVLTLGRAVSALHEATTELVDFT